MFWLDVTISLALPFVALGLFTWGWLWLMQRAPVSSRAVARAQEMGPPAAKTPLVDRAGNVRHEWALDLEEQRLRRSERRW